MRENINAQLTVTGARTDKKNKNICRRLGWVAWLNFPFKELRPLLGSQEDCKHLIFISLIQSMPNGIQISIRCV